MPNNTVVRTYVHWSYLWYFNRTLICRCARSISPFAVGWYGVLWMCGLYPSSSSAVWTGNCRMSAPVHCYFRLILEAAYPSSVLGTVAAFILWRSIALIHLVNRSRWSGDSGNLRYRALLRGLSVCCCYLLVGSVKTPCELITCLETFVRWHALNCPLTIVSFYLWPHKALSDQFHGSVCSRMW